MNNADDRWRINAKKLVIGVVLLLIAIPAFTFLGVALSKGMGVAGGGAALAEQYLAERTNLTVITGLGFLPVLFTALLLGIRRLIFKSWVGSALYFAVASIPVLLVTLYIHLGYWSSYLPNRTFLGFPHGLEFVIGPLVFAPIGILISFVIVWVAGRRT